MLGFNNEKNDEEIIKEGIKLVRNTNAVFHGLQSSANMYFDDVENGLEQIKVIRNLLKTLLDLLNAYYNSKEEKLNLEIKTSIKNKLKMVDGQFYKLKKIMKKERMGTFNELKTILDNLNNNFWNFNPDKWNFRVSTA